MPGWLDKLNDIFGEKTDLPIQVNDDLTTYVEEKRPPCQGVIGSSIFGNDVEGDDD
jgi:hypothetical protein